MVARTAQDATAQPLTMVSRGVSATHAVVLAGGEGRRLQGFVRQFLGTERPKQFCRIVGTRSMLRHTWDRAVRLVESQRIVTIITAGQEKHLAEEIPAGVPGTVLVQPSNKETAAGLLLPILWIAQHCPSATVVVFPADHFIWEEDRFIRHVRSAVAAARAHPCHIVTLGVEAHHPESGYGWIAPGRPLGAHGGSEGELYEVRRFWEKPGGRTAARLQGQGYLWNTFVLAGQATAFLSIAAASIPHVLEPLRAAAPSFGTAAEDAAVCQAYARISPTNFSQAILARKPDSLLVLAARGVTWSDWGEPDHIVSTLRRFDRPTRWLPAYARAQGQPAATPPAL